MRLHFLAVCTLLVIGASAPAQDATQFNARLNSFQETPSILSDGTGTFTATLDSSGPSLSYTLTFSGLSSNAVVSHIHFAERGVAGAVFVFLCGGGAKPACPATGGTVTGTITAADILSVPPQGITGGDFAALLRILRSGNAYVNVHTTNHPGGEIRGQISKTEN